MIIITYFVHGTSIHNEKELAAGWINSELSELGKKQSLELGKIVADKKFELVFCSDLKRAVDTAKLAFEKKYKIIQDKRLREANFGDFTDKPNAHFKSHLSEYIKKPFPGGESYKDVETRILSFITDLKEKYSEKHIAIVAHQAPQLALEVLLNDKTWEQAIAEDWRITKAWRSGWIYYIES